MTRRMRFTVAAWVAATVAILLGAVAALAWPNTDLTPSAVFILCTQALASLAAIPFFIIATKHFRTQLRRVYFLLSLGIGLMGLAQLLIVVVVLAGWWFVIDSGLVGVPFLVS